MTDRDDSNDAHMERWFRSVEYDASTISHFVTDEIDVVMTAAEATEKALVVSRQRIRKNLRVQEDDFYVTLLSRLSTAGYGPFEGRNSVIRFLKETGAHEESPRADIYWDWQHFISFHGHDHRVELSGRTTTVTRYGTVVALHALLESGLQDLCELARTRRKSALALVDLAKGGPDGFKERRYLEKVHSIEVEPALWDGLAPLVFVRNRIAHSSGRISGVKSAREVSLLTQTPGLRLQGQIIENTRFVHGSLHVEPEFLRSCSQTIYSLFVALEASFGEWERLRPVG